MNKHLHEFSSKQSTDGKTNLLHEDPTTSDKIFNSLFSEFDVNINDIDFFDSTLTQESISNTTDNKTVLNASELTKEHQSTNIYQYQQQISSDTNLSTSYSDSNPTDYHQLTTVNPSNQLLTITFDQLQSLHHKHPMDFLFFLKIAQSSDIIFH